MSGAAPGPRPEKAGTQGRIEPILDRLHGLHPRLIDLSLDRLRRLLAALGHPERRLPPVLHVGGTNGKGSTSALMRAVAEAGRGRPGLSGPFPPAPAWSSRGATSTGPRRGGALTASTA